MNQFLEKFRRDNPAYADMADMDLARALHAKFYADMEWPAFAATIGLDAPRTEPYTMADPEVREMFGADVPEPSGFERGVKDVTQGAKQGAMMLTPGTDETAYTEQVNAQRAAYDAQRGDAGFDLPRVLGQVVATLPAALIPGGQASLLSRLASSFTVGALAGGSQFMPSGSGMDKLVQALKGGGAAAVGGEALRGVARLPGVRGAVQKAAEAPPMTTGRAPVLDRLAQRGEAVRRAQAVQAAKAAKAASGPGGLMQKAVELAPGGKYLAAGRALLPPAPVPPLAQLTERELQRMALEKLFGRVSSPFAALVGGQIGKP